MTSLSLPVLCKAKVRISFLTLHTPWHTLINTLWHISLLPYKYHSLSLPQRAPSNCYWRPRGLIEGPGGLLVLLVNGDPAPLLSWSTPLPSSLFYLSIPPFSFAGASGWHWSPQPLDLLIEEDLLVRRSNFEWMLDSVRDVCSISE